MKRGSTSGETREAFRRHAEHTTGWEVKDTHIKSVVVSIAEEGLGEVRIAEGDRLNPPISEVPNETVLAILESNAYLVVTANRGELRGTPYLFDKNKVKRVEVGQDAADE